MAARMIEIVPKKAVISMPASGEDLLGAMACLFLPVSLGIGMERSKIGDYGSRNRLQKRKKTNVGRERNEIPLQMEIPTPLCSPSLIEPKHPSPSQPNA